MIQQIIDKKGGRMNLEAIGKAVVAAGTAGKAAMSNKKVRKFLFGTYSNGKIRSLPDALDGEYLSPKERKEIIYGPSKAKKKKKKKKDVKFKL